MILNYALTRIFSIGIINNILEILIGCFGIYVIGYFCDKRFGSSFKKMSQMLFLEIFIYKVFLSISLNFANVS